MRTSDDFRPVAGRPQRRNAGAVASARRSVTVVALVEVVDHVRPLRGTPVEAEVLRPAYHPGHQLCAVTGAAVVTNVRIAFVARATVVLVQQSATVRVRAGRQRGCEQRGGREGRQSAY